MATIFEVVREKFNDIGRKFDEIDKKLISLYEKTERDKTELIEKLR